MNIKGMNHFLRVCKNRLVDWYNQESECVNGEVDQKIDFSNVYVVWSCKTLQNYKALLSTDVSGDGIYVEFTFNGDKGELYRDVYKKVDNTCITEEV